MDLSRTPSPVETVSDVLVSESEAGGSPASSVSRPYVSEGWDPANWESDDYVIYEDPEYEDHIIIKDALNAVQETFENIRDTAPPAGSNLRKYYSRKLREAATVRGDTRFDACLTYPPCPRIILVVPDPEKTFGTCNCCLGEDVPMLCINAEDVPDGDDIITPRVVLERMREWMYGDEDRSEAISAHLPVFMESVGAGRAAPIGLSYLSSAIYTIMHFQLFIPLADQTTDIDDWA